MSKILIIEDNQDIRELTTDLLTLAGYNVKSAENGKIGVGVALNEPFDLVICDIMMPVLDGYGVLHIFQNTETLKQIPFIFLTAKTERQDFRKSMEMGADDYLTKPFQEMELLNAVKSRLERVKVFHANSQESALEAFYDEAKTFDELKKLSDDKKVISIKKKQIIYYEGDTPFRFYFIKKGKVKTYSSSSHGKQLTINLFNEGEFFGYHHIILNSPYHETAEALVDSEIISIAKQDFLELIFKNHHVANKFIKLLANNTVEKEILLSNMAYNSIRKRTADALLFLLDKFQNENATSIIKISREDLANLIGTATESLIRTLSEFKKEKYIEINGSEITVIDQKKLSQIKN